MRAKIRLFSQNSNKKLSFLIRYLQNRLFSVFVPPECSIVEGVDALADEIGVLGGELADVKACNDAEERQIALDVFAPFVLAQAPA